MAVKKDDLLSLGGIIRWHRKKSGVSQKELADLAGVGKTTVFDVEKGKESVHFDNILKILKVLNLKITLHSPLGEVWDLNDEKS